MEANPFLGTGVFLLGGVAAALYLLPLRWVRGWRYETGWLASVVVGWLVWPLVFDALVAPGLLKIVFADPLLVAKTVGFGVLWGVGALCWALMVRYLGVGLGLAIGAGICAATGTLLPPIVTGNAASLVATRSACVVLGGVMVSLVGIVLVGAAGRMKEGEMDEAAKKRAVADYDFRKGLFTAVIAGVASAGINFGLQGAPEWEKAALEQGVNAIWAGMPVLTVVLWGGVLTQLLWIGFRELREFRGFREGRDLREFNDPKLPKDPKAPKAPKLPKDPKAPKAPKLPRATIALNLLLCSITGVVGMSQFLFQKLGEPMMGEVRYISFAVLMASAIFFSTAVGVVLGEWKGVSCRTLAMLGAGLLVLLTAFALISFAPALARC